MERRTPYRSLFWPVLLIGIGIIWLLVNLGFISESGLNLMLRLWPIVLIAAGLDLLFGRRSPLIGALIGLATLAVIVGLLAAGPLIRLANAPEVKTEHFSEPIGETASANVTLDLWSDPATVGPLAGSSNLIDVEAVQLGQVNFEVSGTQDKTIRLSHASTGIPSFFFDFSADRHTAIRLTQEVPIALTIDIGSGSTELDLRELSLTRLAIDGGSGSAEVTLPSGDSGNSGGDLESTIRAGSGSFNLTLPEGAQGKLLLDAGSGSLVVDIPESAPVRLEVRDSGSGSVTLAAGLQQVSRGQGDEGVWETPGYSSASDGKLLIIFEDIGSGSVRLQ